MLYFQKVILKNQRVQLTETGFNPVCMNAAWEFDSNGTTEEVPLETKQLIRIFQAYYQEKCHEIDSIVDPLSLDLNDFDKYRIMAYNDNAPIIRYKSTMKKPSIKEQMEIQLQTEQTRLTQVKIDISQAQICNFSKLSNFK